MWLCFNDGFVSAVQDRNEPNSLVVRARRQEILATLFPNETIVFDLNDSHDYKYRVFIGKEVLITVLTNRIGELNYPNFKNSVKDDDLHELYNDFWQLHYDYQR